MKAILISIRPQHVANILNGIKTLEIRKKFPQDYVGWVYIYCTKEEYLMDTDKGYFSTKNGLMEIGYYYKRMRNINGKVVARFWCDKVEEHRPFFHWCIEKETCLTRDNVLDYLDRKDKFVGNPKRQGKVYAIHINDLEIFDKPKEIKEFRYYTGFNFNCSQVCKGYKKHETRCLDPYNYCPYLGKKLTRAPQSWCYIEV